MLTSINPRVLDLHVYKQNLKCTAVQRFYRLQKKIHYVQNMTGQWQIHNPDNPLYYLTIMVKMVKTSWSLLHTVTSILILVSFQTNYFVYQIK